MTGKVLLAAIGVALVSRPVAADPKPDYAAIAERVVGTSANVKEGEIVWISVGPQDLAFADELAAAVRKRGAFPIVTYSSEAMTKRVFATMPDKYDAQAPKGDLELTKIAATHINISSVRDPSIWLDGISPERRRKIFAAGASAQSLAVKRHVRLVELDNGLLPSATRAKETGLSEAELTKQFWDGVGADYTAVSAQCKKLTDALAKGGEVHITHPNGTDVKMKLKPKKTAASDGILTDAKVKAGGPGVQVWLPAGEVYFVPVISSVEGKVVDDRMAIFGKEILGHSFDLKAGKVANRATKSGWDAIKADYDAAGPGKDEFGMVDLGCNSAVKNTAKLETWMAAGTVSITTGNNEYAGGTNKEPLGMAHMLSGATLTLDGKALIENGALK
ncbi:MAG TPA: aminopeptidase [Kofleriaceae bacterium]|nr:aminopeptidase [Kofleriaceae bacterium]